MTLGVPCPWVKLNGVAQVSLCFLKTFQHMENRAKIDISHRFIRTLPYRDSGGLKSFLIPPLIVQEYA